MIQHATINGRFHRTRQQNSHDFALSGNPASGVFFGLVLDGCGSKPSHNEVGAKLLGRYAACYLQQELASLPERSGKAVTVVLAGLHPACVQFLQRMICPFPLARDTDRAQFVASHWLATLLGFVVTPETAVFFWRGDGYLVYNGHVITLDSDNRPNYLGYTLLEAEPQNNLNYFAGFQTLVLERPSLQWLAVATDGWQPDLLSQLSVPRPGLQLARWVNVQARCPAHFEDDGAVAVWWGNVGQGSGGAEELLASETG